MSAAADADPIKQATARIDVAIKRNSRLENVIIVVLFMLFVTGIGLLAFGVLSGRWETTVPGGLFELSIALPIRSLVRLRSENVRLQVIPSLLRLADSEEAKKVAIQFIQHLIEQV